MSRQNVPDQFRPHIIPVYPPNNEIIFEEWVSLVYQGCQTDRIFLDINFTSYWVNNDYGNNQQKRKEMQDYVDYLDNGKKYFCIIQYDDGCMVDWKGKDVLEFNMSKTTGVMIPLICQPHPYAFPEEKKYLVSFIGSRTHNVRNGIEKYINKEGWYISYEPHSIERYCEVMAQSVFTIAPRGYGAASFRCYECTQYNSIPIYLSDSHIVPFDLNFNDFGVLYHSDDISSLATSISLISDEEILRKQNNLPIFYDKYFSYIGCMKNIIQFLEQENGKVNH